MYSEALQEILTKIEERAAELRAFCPSCGHMCLFNHTDINCPYGDEDCVHCGYKCSSCYYEWEDGLDDFMYSDNEDLIKYNKMRFGAEHV